jgi:hypothetical protein
MEKESLFDFKEYISGNKSFFDNPQKKESSSKKRAVDFNEINSFLSKDNNFSLELKKQISNFDDGQNLIYVSPINNHDVVLSLLKILIENGKTPVLLLVSSNYKTMVSLINEANLPFEKMFLIDTVSRNIKNVVDQENVLFVDSLRNLTQIQIKILDSIKNADNQVFIFDSFNILSLYHSDKILFKFIYSVIRLLRKNKCPGNFILCKEEIVSKFSQLFDNVVRIKEVE